MDEIAAQGVPCSSGSCSEVYLEKAFLQQMRPPHRLPVARELGETSLMFQVHPTLEKRHLERTAQVVEEVVSRATRAGNDNVKDAIAVALNQKV
jgi:dTDP-4-amino-4,6-dideoxygalactose transaminase